MSMTAMERSNPPPRRRSCAACTKAKRRCDFALPSCLRCSRRNIACHYPGGRTPCWPPPPPPSAPTQQQEQQQTLAPESREEFLHTCPAFAMPSDEMLDSLLADMDMPTTPHPHASSGGGGAAAGIDVQEEPPRVDKSFDHLIDKGFYRSVEGMELIPMGYARRLVATSEDGFETAPFVLQERLQYTLDELQKIPGMFVRETKTPWVHVALYQQTMPKSIRDAHACCGLYTVKNNVNGPVIMRSIQIYAEELVSTAMPTTRLEILARTQALILYGIIRIFDGDVAGQSCAERDLPALEASALALLPHVTFPDQDSSSSPPIELPLFPLGPTEEFWRNWVFLESARRTFMFTFHFILVYALVTRRGAITCEKMMMCRSFTFSAHLWNADNALDFAVAWRTRRHFVVEALSNEGFETVVRDAGADDVDGFGRILLSMYLGVTQAKGWFLTRGGTL